MRKNLFLKAIILVFITSFFSNCVSKKNVIYLQNDEIDQEKVSNNYVTVFKPDDLLLISVVSQNAEAAIPFNLPAVITSTSSNSAVGQASQLPYLVDSKGEIDFPILGKIKIAGLTREEAIELLKERLSPTYLKKPNIYIRITNFKVNIQGAVNMPGTYTIPNERVTILDALSLAGDLQISGKRDNVLVVREENNKKVEYRVDLRSRKLYTSPVFYLQQNDNIYVAPNYASIQSASSNANTSLFVSITGLVITIASLLIR
jgi:polysaccharide export outer membrane protein